MKPVLLYNSSTYGITKEEEKNLRRILHVKYPEKMKNEKVYKKTNEKPITLEILFNRWRMFGHTLGMNIRSPAYPEVSWKTRRDTSTNIK